MGRQLEQADLFEGLVIVHLKASGIWANMNHFRATGRRCWQFKLQIFIILFFFGPYASLQFIYIFTQGVDVRKVIEVNLVNAPTTVLFCKLYFFWFEIEEICSIYDGLREVFLSSIPENKHPQTHDIYRQTANLCNRLMLAGTSGTMVTLVMWCILPGYDTESGRKKLLSGWYPFPYAWSPWFEVVYVFEFCTACVGGISYILYECAILMPMVCFCGHFDVLCFLISTLKKEDTENGNYVLNKELGYILKDYEKLLSYGESLKGLYNNLITIVLGIMIFNGTAVVMYWIFASKDYLFFLRMGSFLLFQGLEMALICMCSSLIQTSSSNIHEALYSNDWYLSDKNFATTTQMMMIRASRPLTLTAIKMYPVNLETLLSIIQFIYSTGAILSKTA